MWLVCLAYLMGVPAPSPQTMQLTALTDSVVVLHVDEGWVEHHRRGQRRTDARVVAEPFDAARITNPDAFLISSQDDPAYTNPTRPSRVGRKSKGTDFAWFVDRWADGRAVNDRLDHAKEHWVYIVLPRPMRQGSTYTVQVDGLPQRFTVPFDPFRNRSEAVRVNNLGYLPWSPAKFGYVFHWKGSLGGLDLSAYEGNRFWLVDREGDRVFEGRLRLRARGNQPETGHPQDSPPHGNFQNADVWECDFSEFQTPGTYTLVVEGVGSSFPFRIGADALHEAFFHTARALYHNRSGIALERPFTEFVRPAPHHPGKTPGFAGRLKYTTLPFHDWGSEGGDAERLMAASKGPLEAWGWYQDAGDWDGYSSHLRVPIELLFVIQMAPGNFRDGQLNIPESGNGIPDLLDEAAWLPRYGHRLRAELLRKGWGTGGIGLRVAGDAFGSDTGPQDVGRGSWEDVDRTWMVSGEDTLSTFGYAGVAAHLAFVLRTLGLTDPEGVDWEREAREAYRWARAHPRGFDDGIGGLQAHRLYASAALYVLTREPSFREHFEQDAGDITPDTELLHERFYGPALMALSGPSTDPVVERMRAAVLHSAELSRLSADRRALRFGGHFFFPMLVGQQTTPHVFDIAVGYKLTRDPKFFAALCTSVDYFLGANSLGITWITGVGPRHPQHVFHMDAWYNTHEGRMHPGLIPYGPWRKESEVPEGPWHVGWPHPTVYPHIDQWPGAKRWFENRNSPLHAEFTVHQNLGPAAAIYGLMVGRW